MPSDTDAELVVRLRDGDEGAFMTLVDRHAAAMLRVASMYVPRAVAEDVVQDTWLGVLQGISRFEERSTLKTWIFSILMNRVRTQAQRERRTVPFSAVAPGAQAPWRPLLSASSRAVSARRNSPATTATRRVCRSRRSPVGWDAQKRPSRAISNAPRGALLYPRRSR